MEPIKFPRISHLPWSKGRTDDDIYLTDISHLESLNDVVCLEKMDGENFSCYTDHGHARSLDSKAHPSRNYMFAFHRSFSFLLPDNIRVCGENMYAKHSIYYDNLSSYFYVFAIFDEEKCWSWDDTVAFCEKLRLDTVPVLYRGSWNENEVKKCYTGKSKFGDTQEGYVVRNAQAYPVNDFEKNVAKMCRPNHVQTDQHWLKKWNMGININELINHLKN